MRICPECGEDLHKKILKVKEYIFSGSWIDGYQLICKTHGILRERKPLLMD